MACVYTSVYCQWEPEPIFCIATHFPSCTHFGQACSYSPRACHTSCEVIDVRLHPLLWFTFFFFLRDNMATYITAGNSYHLFVQWLVKTCKIFAAAGVSEEWEAYFQKIMRRLDPFYCSHLLNIFPLFEQPCSHKKAKPCEGGQE